MTTTITKLDNDTGLPVLPEDLFWRIKEAKVSNGDKYVAPHIDAHGRRFAGRFEPVYKSSGTVRIDLVKVSTKETPAKREVVKIVTKRALGIFPYEEAVVEKEAQPARTEQVEEVIGHGSLLERRDKPVNKSDYADREWTDDYWNDGAYKATPPTKENIRDLAAKIWNEYITDQHGLALAEDGERELAKFLGDYPPKNLSTVGV